MLTRRNMPVPISILPAEFLVHIFNFIAFSKRLYSCTPTLSSIYFTKICRRWRHVVLDDWTLWTHFSHPSCSKD